MLGCTEFDIRSKDSMINLGRYHSIKAYFHWLKNLHSTCRNMGELYLIYHATLTDDEFEELYRVQK